MTKKIYINYQEMNSHVMEIVRQMNANSWKPDYIVGITRGGLLPAVLISHYMDIPMYTLKVSLRDGVENDCDHNAWMSEDAYGYEIYDPMCSGDGRKNILVVDDINDTGATIAWIKQDWQTSCFPNDERWLNVWGNNVRFAVIVNNAASEQDVDYHSMEINKAEDPSWIVFPVEDFWKRTQ